MDEICLRKPPIHLEGELLLRIRNWGRRNWKLKFFMVLGNTLSIRENNEMVGSTLLDVEFDDIDICDGYLKNSRKIFIIQIQLNNGVRFNNETEICISTESKEVYDKWSKGLVYAKHYWLKKSSIPSIVHKKIEDDSGNKFLLEIVMYNDVTAVIQLGVSSEFKDVVKQVNRTGGCYCKICEVSEEFAKLFVVTQDGKILHVGKQEKIYNYFKDGCKFYLMERNRRVLVVFFDIGYDDVTFVSCTAHKDITADEVKKIPQCRQHIPKQLKDDIAVYYKSGSSGHLLDVPLAGDDSVLDFMYDKEGDLLNDTAAGKILIRSSNQQQRHETMDAETKRKLIAGKRRIEIKQQDDIQQQIEEERLLKLKSTAKINNNDAPPESIIIDSENATTHVGNLRGQVATRAVVLSSGQVVHEPVFDDDKDSVDEKQPESKGAGDADRVDITFPDQDIDDIPFEINSNAFNELFLKSAYSSSSELSLTDSAADSSSLVLSSSFKSNDDVIIRHPQSDDISYSQINDIPHSQSDGKAQTTHEEEHRTSNVDNPEENEEETTSSIMEMYATTVLEPVRPECEKTAVDEEQTQSTDKSVDGNVVDTAPEYSKGTNIDQEKDDLESLSCGNPVVAKPIDRVEKPEEENIVLSRKSSEKRAIKKCKICSDVLDVDEKMKPKVIKTNILSFLNKTGDDQYVCLSGIHLRKTDSVWSAVDTCEVSQDFNDVEWNEAMKSRKGKENLGGFVCLFVPSRRGGRWFVRQMQEREVSSVVSDSVFNEPKYISTDDVSPDKIVSTNSHSIDDTEERSSLDDSCEFDRKAKNTTTTTITAEQIKRNLVGFKDIVQQKAVTIKAAIPPIKMMEDGSLLQNIKMPDKFKDTFDAVYDTISQFSFDDRVLTVEQMDQEILCDEFVVIDQNYVKPLKDTIFKICTRFEGVQLGAQRRCGDDFKSTDIGWEVRGDFCTIIANFLRIGMRERTKMIKSFFSSPVQITLWELVMDFSIAFKRQEFSSVIDTIKSARCLFNDDQRFRSFFCELLNRSTMDGTNKLIVAFFELFPRMTKKLEKYYVDSSFWRMNYNSGFGVIMEEVGLSMQHFNGWSFNLHIEFEYRLSPNQPHQDAHFEVNEDSLVSLE